MYLIKYYNVQKSFCLKIIFFNDFSKLNFVGSFLKIHPAVHLNTSKAPTSLQ